MRGVIFDCDGVLLDSTSAWHEAEARVGIAGGIDFTKADVDYLNTCTVDEAAVWFCSKSDAYETPDEVIARIDEYMLEFYGNHACALPGALEFVRALHEAGVPTAVLSSSPVRYLAAGLATCGFADCFDAIVSSGDLGLSKRDPEVFARVVEKLGTDVAETWMVEDSFYSLATARESGLRTLGIYSNDKSGTKEQLAAHADYVFDSLGELGFERFMAL